MKAWKKALAGTLSLAVLAACGGNDNNTEETPAGNDNGDNNGGELSGEIEVWGWNVAAASMELAIEGFNEIHPDVEVNVQDIGRLDLYDRLTVGLAAGGAGLPDVVLVETDRIDNYMSEFPEGFLNLSEYGFDQYEDKFAQAKINSMKNADGDFIAAPWDFGPAAVFYNVEIFEEAGVNPDDIETYDDYIEAGIQIHEATESQLLPIDISQDDAQFRMMMNQQGTYYFDEDGNIDIASDEAVLAMEKIKEMRENDLIANVDGWDGTVTATVNGRVATVPFGVWYAGTIMDQAPEQEGNWDIFPLPALEEGGNRAANLGGSDLAVIGATENPDAAYAFVEYFTTETDPQMAALEEYGMFPSLLETYEHETFDEESEFFNNSAIFRTFAEISEDVPFANYTSDYARAFRYSADAQASALLQDAEPADALREAAERIANESGRDINE
ncbi:sugar ABC transporter substrate-binding protein [Evansella sp. LMS18]|uniref:ABC transporter substrate-binding protein n=1 Tax=Evansella sp. LMS18 TaxID=2924033 RepID=UPI0020D19AC9|nr:sugar ABC transporter substrate-binding protein [Evansella sp. LMS18]UTR11839.1 sugar ABC transporter substrate-binding protein [Evansella sp. LMS18]